MPEDMAGEDVGAFPILVAVLRARNKARLLSFG